MVERNNYLGGCFSIGGCLINKGTLRSLAEKILEQLGVPFEETSEGLFVTDGPLPVQN